MQKCLKTATGGCFRQTGSRNMAETGQMNSQPSTSYSTSYTLWGLSRWYLALYSWKLTIAPMYTGVGLWNFGRPGPKNCWQGGGVKMRYFWCRFDFSGPHCKWKFFPLYGRGRTELFAVWRAELAFLSFSKTICSKSTRPILVKISAIVDDRTFPRWAETQQNRTFMSLET